MSDHERERKREIVASVSDREEKAKMRERDLKREREAFVNDRESERENKQVLTTQSERERERAILLVRRKSNFFLVPNSVTRWLDYFIFIWQLTKMIMLLYIFSKYDPKLAKYQMNI